MEWTEKRKRKIFIRLLVTGTLGIIAVGVLVAVAVIFHFRR